MFQEGFRRWRRNAQIQGYVDNNPGKWEKKFYGKPVISPTQMKERKNAIVLLCSNQLDIINAVSNQLKQMDLYWALLENYVLSDLSEEVLFTYDLLEDERSQALYEYLISCIGDCETLQ